MHKVSLTLAALLVVALVAVPISFQVGKDSTATDLETKYEGLMADMRLTNEQSLSAIREALSQSQLEWERKHQELQSAVRESLLNTGVPLNILDIHIDPESAPVIVDTEITQDVYGALRVGMSYDEVLELVGREGENTLNMLEEDGSGISSYMWKWKNEEDGEERMTITFDGQKLSDKHYTAFKF